MNATKVIKSEHIDDIPDEVFVLVQNLTEARLVDRMNGERMGQLKQQRLIQLSKSGTLHDVEFHDVACALYARWSMLKLLDVRRAFVERMQKLNEVKP